MSSIQGERGRQVSTGRGGAGNILRSPSRGIDPEVVAGSERGRELQPRDSSGDRIMSTGRGGRGNMRSPSRPRDIIAEAQEDELQDQLVHEARGRQAEAPFSTGRGGAGNIRDASRSRSQVRSERREGSAPPVKHEFISGGRGGYGNILHELPKEDLERQAAENLYEADVLAKHKAEEAAGIHHVGKGGAGNVGHTPTPVDMSKLSLEEREAHKKLHPSDSPRVFAGGRGGAGNYHRESPSHGSGGGAGAERRGRDEKKEHGVLGSMFRSLSRSVQGREKSSDRKVPA